MRAISPRSGDEMPMSARGSFTRAYLAPFYLALWPEAARAALTRLAAPLMSWFRRSWLYRRTLSGPVPDRILAVPDDPAPKRLEDADGLLRGRFRFAGQTLDVKQGSVFAVVPPGPDFAAGLHGFDWLGPLEAAGGEPARELAHKLTAEWLDHHRRYGVPAWTPETLARRLVNLVAHGKFFLVNSDVLWRSRFFVSVRNQMRMLARLGARAPDGLPRFEAAAALALAGLALGDAKRAQLGLERLRQELARQILPDGGHVSRSPEALAHVCRDLLMVKDALAARDFVLPDWLAGALDRAAPMLRFFRHSDGGFAVFNGGGEGDVRMVATLLARDETKGQPFGHARHSGFHRLVAGRACVLLDAGAPPDGAWSAHAHAGTLAFEMSSGGQRIVVNCGTAVGHGPQWGDSLRATAAHSTLVLADTSSATLLPPGFMRDLLGPRILAGPVKVESRRKEGSHGIAVDAAHDGYLPRFGITHLRRMTLSPQGLVLTGTDRLIPSGPRRTKGAPPLGFAIRFHVHPDVRLSLAQGGGSVILKLPNGDGWRFRAGGGAVSIEESIYLGGEIVRRTEQLVVSGQAGAEPAECAWAFEMIGST